MTTGDARRAGESAGEIGTPARGGQLPSASR
jgi:hypothetical protein